MQAFDVAVLAAMAFVDQHEDIGAFIHQLALVQAGTEFVDQGGDDRRFRLQQFQQVLAGTRLHRLQAGGAEGLADLIVQVGAVGDHDDARATHVHGQRLGQHHHGQRLARTLGVPDHATLATRLVVALLHPLQQMPHGEELWMAGDLLVRAVEQHEAASQFQQALRPAQSRQQPVLLCHIAATGLMHGAMPALMGGEVLEQFGFFDGVQRAVDGGGDVFARDVLLLPFRPQLGRRAHGGVARAVGLRGDQQLHGLEQPGRAVVLLLVAQLLADGLLHVLTGALDLDHRKRDAVDEQHDVRAHHLAGHGFHRELGGHVEGIGLPVVPVDVAQAPLALQVVDPLRQGNAQLQQVGGGLVVAQQPLERLLAQSLDGGVQVFFGEGVVAAVVANTVDAAELFAQHVLQQDLVPAVASLAFHFCTWQVMPPQGGEGMQGLQLGAAGLGQGEVGTGRFDLRHRQAPCRASRG